ncbi:hypothetical protein D3872_03300 [Massilia cavernae]|uniref:Uncharacterized protein n=1 Tax=Massilia cavernae TaxID=2320864 RepID=A0A418Y707_9BURK|nr:hypothetical protein D3872_03300 [Massilia cavernae]
MWVLFLVFAVLFLTAIFGAGQTQHLACPMRHSPYLVRALPCVTVHTFTIIAATLIEIVCKCKLYYRQAPPMFVTGLKLCMKIRIAFGKGR